MAQVIQISNIKDLQKIGYDPAYPLDGEYELIQDIDASETKDWFNGEGFKPLGFEELPFQGKFNGNGHKVTGLHITRLGEMFAALFRAVGVKASINNLKLDNCRIKGGSYSAGLVSINKGKIENCAITRLNLEGSNNCDVNIGGLVSENEGIIKRCSVKKAKFEKINFQVGGLVGTNKGEITECLGSCITIKNGYMDIGGLIGKNSGKVEKCCSHKVKVAGLGCIGGLIGDNLNFVVNCYSSEGIVKGSWQTGGLIGKNSGLVAACYTTNDTSYQNIIEENKKTKRVKKPCKLYQNNSDNNPKPEWCCNPNENNKYACKLVDELKNKIQSIIAGMSELLNVKFNSVDNNNSDDNKSSSKPDDLDLTVGALIGYSEPGTSVLSSYWSFDHTNLRFSDGGLPLILTDLFNRYSFRDWNFNNVWTYDFNTKNTPILVFELKI